MSESKHATGPWEAVDSEISTVAKPYAVIANVNDGLVVGCGGDPEANARLIAAAPDLLEAAEQAASTTEAVGHWLRGLDMAPAMATDTIRISKLLRAAIRKAKP